MNRLNRSKQSKTRLVSRQVRKGGQLKGTVHRGELRVYYELLSMLMKKDLRKSEIRQKLKTDGRFMKKSMDKLTKSLFIQKADNTNFPKYKITEIGMQFMVYLKELEG